MSKQLKRVPKFANETKERAFWEASGNDSTEYFDKSRSVQAIFPNLKATTTAISLRLPDTLLAHIKSYANKMDVPYQSLMKLWLAEKLGEAEEQVQSKRAPGR